MFEFLKKLMTNNKSVSENETNFLHRILSTDIREVPKSQADEIIFHPLEILVPPLYRYLIFCGGNLFHLLKLIYCLS